MKKTNLIYVSILIFINLFLSACSITPEHNGKPVPVEDRSVTNTSSRNAATDNSAVTNAEIKSDSIESDVSNDSSENIRREESISEQSRSPVALAFLKDADKYTTAGDSARAVASLERGLDIEPKNPWLWNKLASIRLQQKMWTKAITLAKKSNAFASGHNQLQKDNWQIIVEARTALGDTVGADKANEMVERFSRERA